VPNLLFLLVIVIDVAPDWAPDLGFPLRKTSEDLAG